jgi:hypothetical protein
MSSFSGSWWGIGRPAPAGHVGRLGPVNRLTELDGRT